MSHCKFAKLIRDGKTNYPLEEHQRDCDTCQADIEIERLTTENSALKHNIEYYREQLDGIQNILGWKRAKDFVSKEKSHDE